MSIAFVVHVSGNAHSDDARSTTVMQDAVRRLVENGMILEVALSNGQPLMPFGERSTNEIQEATRRRRACPHCGKDPCARDPHSIEPEGGY